MIRVNLECLPKTLDGLIRALLAGQSAAQVVERLRVARLKSQRLTEMPRRFYQGAALGQGQRQAFVGFLGVGVASGESASRGKQRGNEGNSQQ